MSISTQDKGLFFFLNQLPQLSTVVVSRGSVILVSGWTQRANGCFIEIRLFQAKGVTIYYFWGGLNNQDPQIDFSFYLSMFFKTYLQSYIGMLQ